MKRQLLAALLLTTPLFAIDAGDALEFKGKWEAPSYSEATTTWGASKSELPINGAKITIRDQSVPAAADITGHVIAGTFAFTAPSANFEIILEASFPGVAANGEISAAGGSGAFSVKRGIISAAGDSTTKGPVYTFNLGMTLDHTATHSAAVDAQANNTLASEGDVWVAFHGMADMIKEAQKQLDVPKDAFDVAFPADFSYYTGTDIFILRSDRYDWDVIAHEFGHAIGSEQSAEHPNANPGGNHDGTNQYDRQNDPANNTLGNKENAIGLAFSEGFGTWFGAALLERSAFKGVFPNVGDGKYTDTEDGSGVGVSLDSSTTGAQAYGDDTEHAIFHMFWDIHDSRNEANTRTNGKVAGLGDRSALGIKGMWDTLKDNNSRNVSDWYKNAFLPAGDPAGFLPAPGTSVSDAALLLKATDAGHSLAEFGIGPVLFNPIKGDSIKLTRTAADPLPKFEWDQLATGATNDLKLNTFKLAIYTSDFATLLFKKEAIAANEYTMTEAELTDLKDQIDALPDDIATASVVVFGESDTKAPTTGPYLSNAVEVLLQDYNRAVVAVVDSSGSNTSTDPTNQRVVASKESLRRLISVAEAAADNKKPDIAAAIDFDSSVKILSGFADPDSVIPKLDAIDSSGSTSIDGGINAGINLLDNINSSPSGFMGVFKDRSALIVFTDGENNSGQGPVIAAIMNATSKGYRVHYGFLSPLISPFSSNRSARSEITGPGDPASPPELELRGDPRVARADAPPTTIEEAVIRSGGVFARIGDAASQVAFIEQIFSRGLTNSDGSGNSGSLLVGQANTADELTAENGIKTYDFIGQQNEQSRVIVETTQLRPNVTIVDQDGNILAHARDAEGNGRVVIDLTLPYSGRYSVQIFADDDRTGLFNIFVDVENQVSDLPSITATGVPILNPQTGLHEQRVTVTNNSGGDISGFRIDVSGLADGTTVRNATGEPIGGSYPVDFEGVINSGESIEFVLEYHAGNSRADFTPVLAISAGTPGADPNPTGDVFEITRSFVDTDGGFVIEFPSVPGKEYFIQYSEDGTNYETIRPGFLANATRIQWKDSGPPQTPSHPSESLSRFYRVIESE